VYRGSDCGEKRILIAQLGIEPRNKAIVSCGCRRKDQLKVIVTEVD